MSAGRSRYGEPKQFDPKRKVSRESYGPHNLPPGFDSGEGPDNDDYIAGAYYNASPPNPNYRGKPGGS